MAKIWHLDDNLFPPKHFNISVLRTLISNVQAHAGTPKFFSGKTTLKVLQNVFVKKKGRNSLETLFEGKKHFFTFWLKTQLKSSFYTFRISIFFSFVVFLKNLKRP